MNNLTITFAIIATASLLLCLRRKRCDDTAIRTLRAWRAGK